MTAQTIAQVEEQTVNGVTVSTVMGIVGAIEENNDNAPLTPFKFAPLISNHLPSNFRVNYDGNIQYEAQEKRQLIITQNYVRSLLYSLGGQ